MWPVKEIMNKAAPFKFDPKLLCPDPSLIFRVFKETDPKDIRVIICGQDIYPQPGVAIGRAFGVNEDAPLQPSLKIMFDELATSYYNDPFLEDERFDRTLKSWQDQGVLLLNASLTCNQFKPEDESNLHIEGTHSYYWRVNLMEELFTWMNTEMDTIIFVFLGNKAKYYKKFINENKHHVITVPHPAADVYNGKRMFRGSKVFNQINEIIKNINGKDYEIKWLLE